jgi:alkylated DNA repair dioxygenase AlkB
MERQPDLFGAPAPDRDRRPDGFGFWPEVLSQREQDALVRDLALLPFRSYEHLGYLANRRVAPFGRRYDIAAQKLEQAEPWPPFLRDLLACASERTGVPQAGFVQALVNEYQPGAGIGWHRDRAVYDTVLGVSLASPCVMRLRQEAAAGWRRAAAPLPPGSVYLLSGEVRREWEHSISPMAALRYSVTFRSLSGSKGRFIPMGGRGAN